MGKDVRKESKYVDTIVNSIHPLYFLITNSRSNTHNNSISRVDCFTNILSTSSCADQDLSSDEIGYSCDRTTSYPTHSVYFQGNKLHIGNSLSTDDLKALSTPLNGSSSSFISGITTPF